MLTKILIGLGVIGGVTLWLTLRYVSEHVKTHGVHKIIGRTLTGRRTDGQRHTNASFWRKSDGRTTGHPVGRVSKRQHRAGVANLARTLGYVFALLLAAYGLKADRELTYVGLCVAVAMWLGYHGYRLIKRLRHWYIHRTYISPMAEALGPVLEITGPEMEESITMEPDYLTKKTGNLGRIDLPPRFALTPGQLDTITHIVTTRLPVGADLVPKTNGRTPHLLLKAAPALPSIVRLTDFVSEIEKLAPRTYAPGIDRTGAIYKASFAGEEPHHGYCWGSGRGKSTMLKSIVAQTFHNERDATGTVIDPKDVSLDCLVGVPGLDFYNDSEDFERDGISEPSMWKGIRSVYDLMKGRYAQLKEDRTTEFATHLLLIEEANSFALMSKTWWGKNRPKGSLATPPIWTECIAPLFWRGRQAGIFIILVAQSIQERFLGGLSLRASLGLLSMSGWKMNQWDTYVGTSPRVKPQRGKGRALYIEGEDTKWTQTFYASDEEFRDFAMYGRTEPSLIQPTDKEVIKINSVRLNGSVPSPRVPQVSS